jgi:hypothetical protein
MNYAAGLAHLEARGDHSPDSGIACYQLLTDVFIEPVFGVSEPVRIPDPVPKPVLHKVVYV